ncbi:hypothetical protein H0G86_001199 [Trichoderma simmonsii]|uniref:Uncharacterized protein n=1 Tax=Trichoderma simmonsii TaxID=1491479 RepID=A0A8G0L146_9HYPO|nr:hypothetical protein H0G86_001199 [Trichoderma simmonsii]
MIFVTNKAKTRHVSAFKPSNLGQQGKKRLHATGIPTGLLICLPLAWLPKTANEPPLSLSSLPSNIARRTVSNKVWARVRDDSFATDGPSRAFSPTAYRYRRCISSVKSALSKQIYCIQLSCMQGCVSVRQSVRASSRRCAD